jgi:hypothetical protein
VLQIQDGQSDDTITLREMGGQVSVDGITIQTGSGIQASIPLSSVSLVTVQSQGANDRVWLQTGTDPSVPPLEVVANGGTDTLFSAVAPSGVSVGAANIKTVEYGNFLVQLNTDGSLYINSSVPGTTAVVQRQVTQLVDAKGAVL